MIKMRKHVAISVAVLSLCWFAELRVLAQCGSGYVGLNALVAHPNAAVVVVGRVVSVTDVGAAPAQAVTFNVDRVWKGAVKHAR